MRYTKKPLPPSAVPHRRPNSRQHVKCRRLITARAVRAVKGRAHRDQKLSNVLADLRPVEAGAGLVQIGRENAFSRLLQLPGLVSELAAFHAQ